MSTRRVGLVTASCGAIAVTTLTAGIGGAAAAGRASRPAAKVSVRVAQSDAGPLLVDGAGYTVFMFTRDRRGDDRCARISGCLTDWPAVTTTGAPVGGPGVKRSLLGTAPYRGKLRVVTYNGYPLHTYKFDYGKESTMNIGNTQFGGSWFGLTVAGKLIK